ncbi:hypothetical protein J2X19_001105 [Rhodoferax ferrireducens]|uniref:Uncharacterized protein n=1 Tax=Rhodoferax ferrireducens TaxID=192843 RepID=A0ABU2C533_9BURK|nr:hypothetical protein [Rhodoferax ferrireducens]
METVLVAIENVANGLLNVYTERFLASGGFLAK